MRGWFDLVSTTRAETNPPTCRTFSKKRLKGFEPSTFCMAIRWVIDELFPSISMICRAFVIG